MKEYLFLEKEGVEWAEGVKNSFYLLNNLQTLPMYSLGLLQGENRRSGCSQIGEGPALGGGIVCGGGGKVQRKERCWKEEKKEQKILRY